MPQNYDDYDDDQDFDESETSNSDKFCTDRFFGYKEDQRMIKAETDPYHKQSMLRQYEAKYGPLDTSTKIALGIPGY